MQARWNMGHSSVDEVLNGEDDMNGLLDRETSRAQTREIRALGRPVLRSVVDEADGIFQRCIQTAAGADENLGILMPFHHAIEMLDGVEVLLNKSCVVASYTPLRSAFEASLAVRYVLADDTERRALSYVVSSKYKRLHWCEEQNPESKRGKQFIADMGIEEGSEFPMPDAADLAAEVESIREMLSTDPYAPIAAEYERIAKERRGRMKWYSLFEGPSSVREMAKSLSQLDDYLIFYREMSKTVHATDLRRRLITARDGTSPAVTVIRSPIGMPSAYLWGIVIGLELTRAVMNHYRSGESIRFGKWYFEEVDPAVKQLSQIKEEVAA